MQKKSSAQFQKGFTLLEILVVFSLTTLIAGAGFVAFGSYNRQQVVDQAASDLKQEIDQAKFNAVSQVKPSSNCDILQGYRIYFTATGNVYRSYTIDPVCVGEVSSNSITHTFPPTVELRNPDRSDDGNNLVEQCSGFVFETLSNSIVPEDTKTLPCSFRITGNNVSKLITIDNSGNIKIATVQ